MDFCYTNRTTPTIPKYIQQIVKQNSNIVKSADWVIKKVSKSGDFKQTAVWKVF